MTAKSQKVNEREMIGGAWLAEQYGIAPVQPLRHHSQIAASRFSQEQRDGQWKHHFPARYRPEATLAGHLEFMLRYEAVHLEFLYRLFDKIDKQDLESWIHREPTGKYARRSGFFYEWLTNNRLDFEGVPTVTYVEALEPDKYFTRTLFDNNTRWRVRDNLLGDSSFSPTVLLTDAVKEVEAYDIRSKWEAIEAEFSKELLQRSAVYLTVKESRASFAVEHETDQTSKIQRFAQAMEDHTGQHSEPFLEETLEALQRAILGEKATRYGLRKSPAFIGEQKLSGDVVHYIGPNWGWVPSLIADLGRMDYQTRKHSPLLRAAVLSFAFVYIHPMSDGNGRISRYLVNDVLRRDGVLQEPFILPISAVISESMLDYDRILETFSKAFMKRYEGQYRFAKKETVYDDGVRSNFEFDAYDDALIPLRFLDLTDHVVYLGDVVRKTLEVEMPKEATLLRNYRNARRNLNEVIEGSDQDLDRIIRSIQQNNGEVSGKLKAEFPLLEDEETADQVARAVMSSLQPKD